MRSLITLCLLYMQIPTVVSAALHQHASDLQQALQPKHSIRDTVFEDLDELTDLFIAAFSPSITWDYIYQFRHERPDYHRACLREQFGQVWDVYKDYNLLSLEVLTVPRTGSHIADGREDRIVSSAAWMAFGFEFPFSLDYASSSTEKYNCSLRLDINMTRAVHHDAAFAADKKKYIDNAYDEQLYLGQLFTHPDWDGNGFAGELCERGIARAKHKNVPVTLISSIAGYPLYRSLGFESVKNLTYELLDGYGTVWYEVMRYNQTTQG